MYYKKPNLDLAPAIASDYIKINLNIQFHFLEFRNMYINCFHHFLATNNLTVDCDVSGSAAHAVQPREAHTVVAARLRGCDVVKTDLTHHRIISKFFLDPG